jgi:hypothetical protein
MTEVLLERAPRKARAWYKASTAWLVGAVTDPHRHTSSSARIIAFLMWYSQHVYLTHAHEPNPAIVAILTTGGIIPLVVRTKSTQEPKLLLPRPPIVVATPEATHV